MSANGEKTTRRERVERGIYRNPKTGAYEITFTDSDGKRRWTTIDGNLKAARAARAEVVAKLGRASVSQQTATATLSGSAGRTYCVPWSTTEARRSVASRGWMSSQSIVPRSTVS